MNAVMFWLVTAALGAAWGLSIFELIRARPRDRGTIALAVAAMTVLGILWIGTR